MEERRVDATAARRLYQLDINAEPRHIAVWPTLARMEEQLDEWALRPACTLPGMPQRCIIAYF